MGSPIYFNWVKTKLAALLVFAVFIGNAQTIQVNIFGGAAITNGGSISISAGSSLEFQITNTASNCGNLRIDQISLTNFPTYYLTNAYGFWRIKPSSCSGNNDYLNFTVGNNSTTCASSSTIITIETNKGDFTFTLNITGSPAISVSGGSPLASITNGATTTTADNGTYFGVVESGNTITHGFYITNTGSCALNVSGAITSNLSNFVVGTPINPPSTPLTYPFDIDPGASVYFPITFSVGATTGKVEAIITIPNNDIAFTFKVEADVFNYDIPGPGGIIADFRLWLKANRGVVRDGSSKVSEWTDRGTNGKNATQTVASNQPTHYDDISNNINFNPVIKFENDGSSSLNQYLLNDFNGFYTQEIFVVMKPDVDVTTSTGMTILSGTVSNYSNTDGSFAGNANYDNDGDFNMNDVDPNSNPTDDVTGIGLGNFSARIAGERLWYNQGSVTSNPYYTIEGSNTETYSSAQILNVHNKTATVTDGMRFMYNGIDPGVSATSNITYDNLGYDNAGTWFGTPYKIGKNINDSYGNLNGRIAEIMTYASRVQDTDRPKIESYLAIKYGITLGVNGTSKNYISSNGIVIWDASANAGFNYNIAGIGKDTASDLHQKQSKSQNEINEVAIYLGNVFDTNSKNINAFTYDGNYLVWGCNGGSYSSNGTNTVTIGSGLTSIITKIDRKWKIVATVGAGEDIGDLHITIPQTALTTTFSKLATEEYALVVSDNANFADGDIIDVIPLKLNGVNLHTWYDFEGTNYFTFAKIPKVTSKSLINIASGDYLIGEYSLELNTDAFSVSAWVRAVNSSANPRTIMAKGAKIQMRLNTSNQVEIVTDNSGIPIYTSTMVISDIKWHYLSFVFQSGTVLLYIDGVLDKSIQNIDALTPNFNHFSVGVLFDGHTTSNPFMGEIDEISIFDYALTQPQVRYLMNQEIVKTSGAKVSGKIIPETTFKNEVNAFDWSKLKAYYDFNSFYGSTVEGQTDNRNFLRINYLSKGKSIINTQTAPIPYVSASDGEWGTEVTWVNGALQNIPNSVGLNGSTMVDWNIVEIGHNITSGNKDIAVLGLISTGGKLTIADPLVTSPVELNDGQGLRVTHYLKLDGVIDLVGESQLVQNEGSDLDNASLGYLDRDQQGTASSYNYNYWSSSVGPIAGANNADYTISGVLKDGTDSSDPKTIAFSSSYTAADLVSPPSPRIISSYWLWKFYGADNDYNAWAKINETTLLKPGEGYTMKGTFRDAAITTNQNYKFRGKPYNGDITLLLDKSSGDVSRLIGNPYPSAIDADEFILDHIKTTETINDEVGRNSVNVFNGALYFWHHFAGKSHFLAEYEGGYATYTLMGGTMAYATETLINNTGNPGNKIPERNIPVNQGFFVNTTLPVMDGITSTVEGGTITFKNSQRIFERERFTGLNDGSLFFKTASTSKATTTKENTDKRPKIWLQYSSPKGYFRQLLVGVAKNATNNFDIGYDAPIADLGKEDMFWTFNNANFVIQAVNNFDRNQELSFGLKLEVDGLATIKVDKIENVDDGTELYIKDNTTGETYQINNQPFEMNLVAGEYLDRFSLVFQPRLKTMEEISTIDNGIFVYMNNNISELQIKRIVDTEIKNIYLMNYLGQTVGNWKNNLSEREISIPIKITTGVYIVQINTKDGIINKKIVIN